MRFIPVSDMVGAVSGFRASARQGSFHRCHQQLGTASFAESLGWSRVTQWTSLCCSCPRCWIALARVFQSRFNLVGPARASAVAALAVGCERFTPVSNSVGSVSDLAELR